MFFCDGTMSNGKGAHLPPTRTASAKYQKRLRRDYDAVVTLRDQVERRERQRSERQAKNKNRSVKYGTQGPLLRRETLTAADKKRPKIYWKGADIIIANANLPDYRGSSVLVISEHAAVINRTLRQLARLKLASVNYFNKLEFYGSIADRLNAMDPKQSLQRSMVLKTLFNAALSTLHAWQTDTENRI